MSIDYDLKALDENYFTVRDTTSRLDTTTDIDRLRTEGRYFEQAWLLSDPAARSIWLEKRPEYQDVNQDWERPGAHSALEIAIGTAIKNVGI